MGRDGDRLGWGQGISVTQAGVVLVFLARVWGQEKGEGARKKGKGPGKRGSGQFPSEAIAAAQGLLGSTRRI